MMIFIRLKRNTNSHGHLPGKGRLGETKLEGFLTIGIGDPTGYELCHQVLTIMKAYVRPLLILVQIWYHHYCWLCPKAVF